MKNKTTKKINEFSSRKEWEEFVWQKLIEEIAKIQSKEKVRVFLESLISEAEKNFIIKRLIAMSLIKKGKKYREIGEILWISPNTISAIKKSIKSNALYTSRYKRTKKPKENRKNVEYSDSVSIDLFEYWAKFPFPEKFGRRWKFVNYQG